ncbi:hypothetical protein SAPIO_CDS2369 [Scedosporium apiospermum]|uniref:UVI-1 protein n=1 Tax=Pseudallescheria apiosperma TaxID=563466 RepID=A0A084GCC1_PSEDA|nr:uncharacterized protein SAPIO_CDS2369 [Scedosporium apiospermum]KEZ44983.1 hypothetical protein SAPIO_CDS2369 [Scedosporium apiospermum]
MRFSILKSVVTAMALTVTTVLGNLAPQQIVDGLDSLTAKAVALQPVAQSITILNAPLIVIGQGPFPQLIAGFADIASTGNALISQMDGQEPVQPGPSEDVYNAVRRLVQTYQALLNILIGKAGLLERIPIIGEPVAASLRGVQGALDSIFITLINVVESRANDITSQANSLENTLDLTIGKYQSIASGL